MTIASESDLRDTMLVAHAFPRAESTIRTLDDVLSFIDGGENFGNYRVETPMHRDLTLGVPQALATGAPAGRAQAPTALSGSAPTAPAGAPR